MATTCVIALVVTATVGLCAEMYGRRDALAVERERSHDAGVRAELTSLGFGSPASEALRELGASLLASHGVEIMHAQRDIELALDNGTVTATAPSEPELVAATVLIVDELRSLPAGLLMKSDLSRVLLLSQLAEDRRTIPSLPNYRRSLIIDVDASPAFLRRLLYHEVFHFIDLADDGEVLRDPAWEALNPPGFHYGSGGRAMRDSDASELTSHLPGFATRYATAAIEEDKAELFAFLMTEPAALRAIADRDRFLASKIDAIETLVARVDSSADPDYWQRRSARH
jgi:hypothetical protein